MHAYYQKSKNKLQREMNNYLKLVKPELEEIFRKPYPQIFAEVWEYYEQAMLEHFLYRRRQKQRHQKSNWLYVLYCYWCCGKTIRSFHP